MNFNRRVGANLRHFRTAAGISQADLAGRLAVRGLPFQQPTILKVEKGSRPLKFEEAHAIAEILGIELAALVQYDEKAAEEAAQRAVLHAAARKTLLKVLAELEGQPVITGYHTEEDVNA